MSMEIKCALFKRHGVLTEFERTSAAAYLESLIPCDLKELKARWLEHGEADGFPKTVEDETASFAKFWKGVGDDFSMDEAQIEALYNMNFQPFLKNYDESLGALRLVKAHGVRVGVLTSFPAPGILDGHEFGGLGSQVDAVHSVVSEGRLAIEKDDMRILSERMGHSADEVMCFVDDALLAEALRDDGFATYVVNRNRSFDRKSEGEICNLYALVELLGAYHLSEAC